MRTKRQSKRRIVRYLIIGFGLALLIIVILQVQLITSVIRPITQQEKKNSLRDPSIPAVRRTTQSLSIILASDISHLEKLSLVVNAWSGPISVGLCVFPRETDYWEEVVHDLYLPSRVAVHSFQTKSYSFPINELRNLALSKATTTHVFISDVDIIPAANLRETFLSLPSFVLRDSMHALIVPLFETPFKSVTCEHWYECIDDTEVYSQLTKKQLIWCLQFGGCKNLGNKDFNKYMDISWESLPLKNYSTPLHCWDNLNQEPYIIVAKSSRLPQFNPAFIDYGYNKIEWLNHLRLLGYRFSVLSHSWAFHVKHERSQYAIRSKEKSDPTRGIKGGVNTAKIFDRSFKQYESENKGMARLELCSAISTVVMEEVGGSDGNEVKVQKRIDRKNRRIRKKG